MLSLMVIGTLPQTCSSRNLIMHIGFKKILLIIFAIGVLATLLSVLDVLWSQRIDHFAHQCAASKGTLIDCNGNFSGPCHLSSIIEGRQVVCSCPDGFEWDLRKGCILRNKIKPDQGFLTQQYMPSRAEGF